VGDGGVWGEQGAEESRRGQSGQWFEQMGGRPPAFAWVQFIKEVAM
jgi:hypothetical protein